jgi:F-type H+-transporting ATPase subunit epsilon
MDLTILTPHRKLIEKEAVDELFVPGFKGQLNILPGHANLVSELETGTLLWRAGGGKWKMASISTGFLEIFDGHVTVLADVSELGEDIDLERAKLAEGRAKQKLEEGGLDDTGFRKYELKLRRSIARQQATGSLES